MYQVNMYMYLPCLFRHSDSITVAFLASSSLSLNKDLDTIIIERPPTSILTRFIFYYQSQT